MPASSKPPVVPFGPLVKEARRLRGWTQQQLADELGVLKPRVSAIERDAARMSLHERLRWAKVLGIPAAAAAPELADLVGPDPGPPAITLVVDGSARVADPRIVVPATEADRGRLDAIGWTAPHRYDVGSWGFGNLVANCTHEGIDIRLACSLPPKTS
jgi:transcriptional regulator with XRE-family HTH domain